MPSKYHLAEMIRADMEDARGRWIKDAAGNAKEQLERQRSDFLAATDHAGRKADFYSLRHSHGTELGAAGTPQQEIAASLHHTRQTTTERYLHAQRTGRAKAIAALPDILEDEQARATGTAGGGEGAAGTGSVYRSVYRTGNTPAGSGGSNDSAGNLTNTVFDPGGGNRTHTSLTGQRILSPGQNPAGDIASADSAGGIPPGMPDRAGPGGAQRTENDEPEGGVEGVLARLAEATRALMERRGQ